MMLRLALPKSNNFKKMGGKEVWISTKVYFTPMIIERKN